MQHDFREIGTDSQRTELRWCDGGRSCTSNGSLSMVSASPRSPHDDFDRRHKTTPRVGQRGGKGESLRSFDDGTTHAHRVSYRIIECTAENALVLVFVWNVFKYHMTNRVCHYTFPANTACPKYQEAWQDGFRNSKIVTTATNVQVASSSLENSNNTLLSSFFTPVKKLILHVDQEYRARQTNIKKKCETGGRARC